MPFPKANQGKAGQEQSEACGLCEAPVDKQQTWIEAACTTCGTRPYHFACVSQFMEREVRHLESKGNRKNDKNLLYAREYPQNIFARNSHIMSRKPVCPGKLGAKDCPGIMDSAEIIRPKLEGDDAVPTPGLVPTARKAKPPVGAVTGKAHKAGKSFPKAMTVPRNESSSSVASSSVSVNNKLVPAPSKPGGGVAALLGGSKAGEAGGAAPTFAQMQLLEEKASRREQREQRARDKAAAADLAARPASAAAEAQQSGSGSSNTWSALAGPEGGAEGGDTAASWLPQEAGGVGAGAEDAASWLPNWHEGHAPEPHPHNGDDDDVMRAAIAASLAHAGGLPDPRIAHASWAHAAPGQDATQHSLGWAQSPATPSPAPAVAHAAPDDEAVTFDDGFAAGLAAALRQQQGQLQRQWQQQQEQQQDVWGQPDAAPAAQPRQVNEMEPEMEAAYWEAQVAPGLAHAEPAEPAAELAGQGDDAEVDELLALMGIA